MHSDLARGEERAMRALLHVAVAVSGPAVTATIGSYIDVGPGYCTTAGGPRVQAALCDDSGAAGKGKCVYTQEGCAALCTADSQCTGYMTHRASAHTKNNACRRYL